ncbi:MAG: tricorn protease [Bacteroidota bacterium]|nr:tricorn protease [Bacteroidota bacterium]
MKILISIFAVLLFISVNYLYSEETRLLRYPNSSETEITFCYGGDIYSVPIKGGLARRLTSSEGIEMFPRFSQDGSQIAFSAEYDGNREIYVMPNNGGAPKRLTWSMDIPGLPERMGPDKIIMQWTSDGKILYRSRHLSWQAWVGNLFKVSTDGGLPEELPLPSSGFGYLSPDGSKIAYNRIFREFRTWKRYRGGQANDVWIYDFKTRTIENITNNKEQDIIPMWHKNKIYYASDRDSKMNLYVYDADTKKTTKLTDFKEYDVKFPSLGARHIAFENGGSVYLLDLNTDKYEKVNIQVAGDFPDIRGKFVNVKEKIDSYEISPDGKRALFSARGDLFAVPAENGNIRNLTMTPGVHERNCVWSPDGRWIAYISDKSGKDEIYIMKGDGSEILQLTDSCEAYRYELVWSPDSKKLLCSDKTMKVYFIDIASKKRTDITQSKIWEIRDYNWSPDSKWIAYTDFLNNQTPVVYLYSLDNGSITQVTSEFFESSSPEFSSDGKYLFFKSDRTFNPQLGAFEMSYIYTNLTKIYGVTLQDSLKSPFIFRSDEVEVKKSDTDKEIEKKEKKLEKKEKKETESKDIKIDTKGIMDRIFELPINAGTYGGMVSKGDKLYYAREKSLYYFDFNKREEKKIGDFAQFEIAADADKILFRKDKDYYIEKLDDNLKAGDGKLNLDDMKVNLDYKAEWTQIFNECWRQMKDFFYDPNMHKVDWNVMKERYGQLLPYVVHRADLTYIIGEMISELSVGHSYTGGGDMPKVESVPIGLLGIDFELDKASGFYKITKIYQGRNWEEKTRSPFTEPGVDVKAGDYITAIDGGQMTAAYHPYKALLNKADKYVTVSIATKPDKSAAKDYSVKTLKSEVGLRYFNWVENNMQKVAKATGGKVGYVHIPDMGFDGLNEFVKNFYPQIRKEGMIIDDRFNGGGFVSQMIIERLRRELTMAEVARNQRMVFTYPGSVFTGPMVCMLNELSASDGDIFPYQFKANKIGTLIGKRSWGGIIGIRGSLPLLDGGYLFKPEFSHFGVDGKWVVEGIGTEPDIEIDNNPAHELDGIDDQLNKAIEVVQQEMKTTTKPKIPEVPPFPDKSK